LKVPIYEYQCDDCEHKFERLQKMSDALLTECPDCGTQALRKLVSAAAFRLSGSGWYETDFKDKKEQKNLFKSDNKPQTDSDSKKSDSAETGKSASADSNKSKTTSTDNSSGKKAKKTKPTSTSSSSD
jgi:putative FmdB family regulatory protein